MKRTLFAIVLVLLIAAGCSGGGASDSISIDEVVNIFEEEGLEVGSVEKMNKDDYGMAPMKAEEGKRFYIPSLGENAGGRIMSYDDQGDLEEMKKYYDDLGEESAMFFSWTMAHENILIQINGDLPEEKYEEYKAALESL